MEYIDGGILRHCLFCVGKGVKQEFIELVVRHVVVLDLPGAAFIIYIVGRVSHREVGELPIHQQGEGICLGTVAADEAVIAEQPQVAELRDGGLLQFLVNVEVVLFYILRRAGELIQLRVGEAEQRDIKGVSLQVG